MNVFRGIDLEVIEIRKWTDGSEEKIKRSLAEKKIVAILCDVPLVEEMEIKKADDGLLLGPCCSFSLINGKGVGIWNEIKKGPIGLIGSSSSGLRMLACMLSEVGISHAIHVGWRDFSQAIGGLSTIKALKFLKEDPDTECIAVIGVLPNQQVVKRIMKETEGDKPVLFLFLGYKAEELQTLEKFAQRVAQIVGCELKPEPSDEKLEKFAEEEASKLAYGQKYVRGIFSGRFACVEAQLILSWFGKTVYSNVPLKPRLRLPDPTSSQGHTFVDISMPELSPGVNPIVDPSPYVERIVREAKDEQIGALVFDIVLGHGAHEDPASVLSEAVIKARRVCESTMGYLPVFATIVGTDKDPQNLSKQRKKLEETEVILTSSTSRAITLAAMTAGFQK
ncbi:MAG: hypothetical protein QXU01_01920 [Candidatus Hadarchaeales archaeon]